MSQRWKGYVKTDTPRYLADPTAPKGRRPTLTYRTWTSIKERCLCPTARGYEKWGGRGIRICEQWRDFDTFLADVGTRPSAAHTLDRIDNDGHYEPGNVRWATRTQQQRNKSTTMRITAFGKTQSVSDWAEETGLPVHRLRSRMRYGWTGEQVLLPGNFRATGRPL